MLRDTMISTMPVAMMAIEVLCTDRFHRLRAVRKSPPDRMLNPIQMTARATIIPTMRVSISADASHDRASPTVRRWRVVGTVFSRLGRSMRRHVLVITTTKRPQCPPL